MKCQFCDQVIPDNSEFCLLCGRKLVVVKDDKELGGNFDIVNTNQAEVSKNPSNHISRDSIGSHKKNRFCKRCGNPIDPEKHICSSCGFRPFNFSIKNLLFLISVILLVSSIAYLVFLRTNYLDAIATANEDITSKESIIETLKTDNLSLENNIKTLNKHIDESEEQISLLEKDSKTLDVILSFLQSSNAGFASSKFKASDKIFVVKKNDIQTSFTLTCGFSGSTTVSTRNSGTAANIVFTQDEWYGATTKLLISPKSIGTAIITFSNNQNTQTFKILIVVIE